MRKIIIATVWTATAAAAALDVGVGGFYAPGMAVGPASDVNELKVLGFGGALKLDLNNNLGLSLGGGYNVYKYREPPHIIPLLSGYAFFDEISILMLTAGVDYGLPISKFTPYVAGGAALAVELARYKYQTNVDVAPGRYAGAGIRSFLLPNFAFEVGPRYTLLFDNPIIVIYSSNFEPVRAEERSQLVDLRVGFNYNF
jgi:hypothetical protein